MSSESLCPLCAGPLDLRSPHVSVIGTRVRAFCSPACLTRAQAPRAPARRPPPRLVRVAAGLFLLSLGSPTASPPPPRPRPLLARAVFAPPVPVLGPSWPSERDWQAMLADDAWLHPLDGPSRRMPESDGRVFGAERAGDRPGECRSGHCGVDLSGPWGERVHAAHDGVVERVQRGPNEEHGGLYVRIAHREGTVFTQYFHLAAIPQHLRPGVTVHAGELIGLLGDSGVKRSAPHLHFTISVRPSERLPERYVDPEPLIALWPLRVEHEGMVRVARAAPGLPRGAAGRPRAARRSAPPVELDDAVAVE